MVTNREAIIQGLQARTYESDITVVSYIDCPYYSDDDCKNPHKIGTTDHQMFCDECKAEWLDKEYEG